MTLSTLGGAVDWAWFNGWAFAISVALNVGIAGLVVNKPRVLRNRAKLRQKSLDLAPADSRPGFETADKRPQANISVSEH